MWSLYPTAEVGEQCNVSLVLALGANMKPFWIGVSHQFQGRNSTLRVETPKKYSRIEVAKQKKGLSATLWCIWRPFTLTQ